MDRDKDTAPETRFSQTRVISPLTITSASKRRSLFSRSSSIKDEETRPASAEASPEHRVNSSTGTRIPRLSQHRSSFTLTDAYRLAQEEEEAAARGSPSPAPRSWRSRRESSEKNASRLPNVGFLGSQHRRTMTSKSTEVVAEDRAGIPTSLGAQSLRSNASDSSFDEKIRQHALAQRESEVPIQHSHSTSSKAGFGTKILETGRGLVRRSSRGGIEGGSSPRNPRPTTGGNRFSGLLSRRKRESSSSTQTPDLADWIRVGGGSAGDLVPPDSNPLSRPTSAPPDHESPEKSFAWDAENDFTAGDLQTSDSPPLNLARTNTKIDEIRALEAETSDQHGSDSSSWRNNRIDEIRNREAETLTKYPDSTAAPHEVMERGAPLEQGIPNRSRSESNTSTKMDDLRSREIEGISRRAITTAQLGKIRERNAELTSRSPSPDIMRKSSTEPLRSFSPPGEQSWRRRSDAGKTLAQPSRPGVGQDLGAEAVSGNTEIGPDIEDNERQRRTSESAGVPCRGSRGRDESRDVLRRLSAAAATGHVPDLPVSGNTESATGRERQRQPSGSLRQRMFAGAKGDGKQTVGFVGLRRNDSIESNLTKRSSFILSESDPTERIEGEMNLFAPHENQSERGSLRALSPEPAEEASDKTPKPPKPDPLTMPTPRVTGAFVETPATVKVEKIGDLSSQEHEIEPQSEKQVELPTERGRMGEIVPREAKQTQSFHGDRLLRRSSSLSVRRRARSLSRGRSLINSAKPPTVRDDILEIQRAHQIEDSTLDDIADLLLKHGAQSPESDDDKIKIETDSDNEKEGGDQDAKRLRRMSESLQKGIMNIRTAKQGIQRLEDQVAQGNVKSTTDDTPRAVHTHDNHDTDDQCPICRVNPPIATTSPTYVHLPLPRLWHQHPRFRLTFLGLCIFLLSLWYVAESWMCHLYCKPPYCAPGEPCDWDIDCPTWGYTIPTKLDEWTMGGQGKELMQGWTPEVTEWVAGLLDTIMSNDTESSITSRWSHSAKRRRRKRILRKGSRQPFERGRWGWKREHVSGMVGGEERMTADDF
ncbi:hypothetical protein QBC40DRAFT_285461 [Triangularia verruculosa]|uniref:Uncharacterized protein n=1 Tax=Triangularia verruculosa TaxID=2587418 RepID=A0AAN6XCC2_9PEZI|nr:hypothetical protein QBC40DRAFT_285461 [Triangularia verruculosa]